MSLQRSLDCRSDAALFGLILLACLVYAGYAATVYLISFDDGIFDWLRRPVGRDFVNYWSAGVAVFDGAVLQIFDARLFHSYQETLLGRAFSNHNWSYPPHMLLLVWPFGQLPYLWALGVWSVFWLGIYLWASTTKQSDGGVLALALLLAPATWVNLTGGQNGFLTGALLIGGMRLLGTRPVLAGVLFGILTVKPQLGILLPFALLAARQWHATAAAVVSAAAMVGASVLWFGWESWQAYVELVIPYQSRFISDGFGNYLTMMPSAYIGMRLLEAEPLVRSAAQVLFALAALAGVVWTFARSRDAELKFAVLAVGTFLASPYSFNYDMTTVSLALALMVLRGMREGFLPGERGVLMAAWFLPIAIVWLNTVVPIAPLILLSCYAYLLVHVRRSLDSNTLPTPAALAAGGQARPS